MAFLEAVKLFGGYPPILFLSDEGLPVLFEFTGHFSRRIFIVMFIASLFLSAAMSFQGVPRAGDREVFFLEEFNELKSWNPLTFPKIKEHSSYQIESEGDNSYLRAESRGSASAIVLRKTFDVYRFPKVRWKWKVENVYEKGDVTSKKGDDYPMRLYVMFRYDPDEAGFGQKVKYGAARLLYGEYPPHSSLNYIWANREEEKGVYASTYTDRSRMIPLESGGAKTGIWVTEEVDIIRDYRGAFGEDPPKEAGLGIMNDSDNTGEASVSYMDDIEVFSPGMETGNNESDK